MKISENNKKYGIILLIFPILSLTLLYISGFICQFLINYQIWTAAGGTPGNGTSPALPSAAVKDCFTTALTSFPHNIYSLLISIGLTGFLIIIVMRMGFGGRGVYDESRNLIYSDKGTYGTSGFMTDKEMLEVLELVKDISHCCGTILGVLHDRIVCLPENTRMNHNVAVFGASGSMKSRAYARNMVFQCVKRGESLIITDPKSELYCDLCLYLTENGYTVRVFNLIHPENSDSWNCLAEIGGNSSEGNSDTEIMAQLFCDVIIKNTGSAKGDHFWDNSEMNLLKALVLYVDLGFPPEGRNIGQVYKLLTMSSEKELNALFDLLPVTHPAKAPYNIFKQASDAVRSGVIIGLGTRLQVFQNEHLRRITSYDEINLTRPGYEKCAYFCVSSDQDSAFDFLSSLFMSFVFIKLVRYADRYGENGRLPVPVHILADELANGGVIVDLCKKISTIRSRALSISCIFQNLPQMQVRYPDNQWQEIIGNCDTQLFLGCTDELTARFISDRSGEVSVGVSSQAKQLNTWRISDYTPEYRETHSVGKRKLLTPDEVLRLPLDQALIILRGQKVLQVGKYDYTRHPESKKLKSCHASEHVPEWRGREEAQDPDFGGIIKSKASDIPNSKTAATKKRSDFKHKASVTMNSSQLPSNAFTDGSTEAEVQIIMTDKNSIMS